MPLLPCPRWLDPAVWCFSRDSLESSSAQLPASSTPLQPHRLVHGRSEPSLAAAAGSASAGWQLPQQPTAADCLRSSTPVMMAPQAQPVMPVGTAGAAGAARHGSWPLQGHQLPSAEAAEAAVVAARRQRQQARQAATAESPLQPLPPLPGSRPGSQLCFPDATPTLSHQGVAAAAQPPLAQPSVTVGRLAEAEAMLAANGGAIVTRVPGVSKRCTETCMLPLHSAVLQHVWLSGHMPPTAVCPTAHCRVPHCAGLSRGAGGRRPCRQAKPKPLGPAAQRPGPCCKQR